MINNTPLRVFDEQVVEFLGGLSADLLKSPLVRTYPDLAAFAFYIRKANLLKLKESLFSNGTEGRVGRGLCFHIAPSNIPVNFAFTWVFGLLAGNANVVRLPSKLFPQVEALLGVINRYLASDEDIARRNSFVRYPRTDTGQTAAYCAVADARDEDCSDACDEKPCVVDNSRDYCGGFVLRRFRVFVEDGNIKNLEADGPKQKVNKIN